MEVQVAWLEEPEAKDKSESPSPAKQKPPRLPGTREIPPMPAAAAVAKGPPPPRRGTIEVDMRWVELVDEPPAEKVAAPAKVRPRMPPIPREDD
jgi:hypothetical protein